MTLSKMVAESVGLAGYEEKGKRKPKIMPVFMNDGTVY